MPVNTAEAPSVSRHKAFRTIPTRCRTRIETSETRRAPRHAGLHDGAFCCIVGIMKPTSIKQIPGDMLTISWDNNEVHTIPLKLLRKECPCAECKGETILMHHYEGIKTEGPETPRKYELKSLEIVGTYAIQPTWGDGHATGIFPWDYLYRLCISFT